MDKVIFSVWLVPTQKDKELISKIINELAKHYGSSAFIPHLTLYVCVMPKKDVVKAKKWVKNSIKDIAQISLNIKKLNHSAEFFRAIFAEMSFNRSVEKIYRRIRQNLAVYKDYQLKPHISLLYKELPEPVRQKIISGLSNLPTSITFSEIGYIVHKQSDHRDIGKWRYQKLCQL